MACDICGEFQDCLDLDEASEFVVADLDGGGELSYCPECFEKAKEAAEQSRTMLMAIGRSRLLNVMRGNLSVIDCLPDDAVVEDVFGDWHRQAVVLRVWSHSFAPVPAGSIPPEEVISFSDPEKKP